MIIVINIREKTGTLSTEEKKNQMTYTAVKSCFLVLYTFITINLRNPWINFLPDWNTSAWNTKISQAYNTSE
jgi:hypothetical protein